MADGTEALQVHSPATGERLGSAPVASPTDVAAALERARRAQAAWGALSVKARVPRLARLKARVVARADEIAALVSAEVGKPLFEAFSMEVMPLLELIATFEAKGPEVLSERAIPLRLARHRKSALRYAPRGVVALISPWNFPVAIPGGELYLALLAGNAVLLKPSEHAPLSGLLLGELVREAGLPEGLVEVLCGGPDVGAALVESGVDYVAFTGSTASGRQVARACGERLVPFRVELGGKGSAVVLDDADLGRTAPALVWGAFTNAGQVCAGVQRVYAARSVFEPLRRAVVDEARKLRVGDPSSPDCDVGRVCPPFLAARVRELLSDALSRGAVLEVGELPEDGSHRVCPIVLSRVPPDARVVVEECFGPVLALVEVADEHEALTRFNALPFGLMGSVFSRDKARARRVAERLRAGTVMVNDVVWSYGMPETPWVGLKQSGMGVTHGDEGLREYCELRHVNEERVRLVEREPWWFPYSPLRLAAMKAGMKALYGEGVRQKLKRLIPLE